MRFNDNSLSINDNPTDLVAQVSDGSMTLECYVLSYRTGLDGIPDVVLGVHDCHLDDFLDGYPDADLS